MRWPRAESVLPKRDAKTRRAVRDALSILRAGLAAVEPKRATADAVNEVERGWRIGVEGAATIVPRTAPMHVLAVGKAAPAMAAGFAAKAPFASMLVVAPAGVGGAPKGAEVIASGHPLPNLASFRAGQRALELAGGLRSGDLLVVLVSGGASSLLEDAPVPPRDYAAAMRTLVKAGLTIEELNTVRKHLSNVKGGQLALEAAARGVSVVALLLSDVPSNRLDAIGSGLTAADPTTFRDAMATIQRFRLGQPMPRSVMERLRDGARARIAETPKPGLLPFARVTNAIVASNETARAAMRAAAERSRYRVIEQGPPIAGEARLAGHNFARRLLANRRKAPLCLIAGGETTVRVRGRGHGGRNQEFALGAAKVLAGSRGVVAAFGTDGVDGNSANAGAIVDGLTIGLAEARGLDPERFFARSDSSPFFETVGGALRTGPTGTNVADVVLGLTW